MSDPIRNRHNEIARLHAERYDSIARELELMKEREEHAGAAERPARRWVLCGRGFQREAYLAPGLNIWLGWQIVIHRTPAQGDIGARWHIVYGKTRKVFIPWWRRRARAIRATAVSAGIQHDKKGVTK